MRPRVLGQTVFKCSVTVTVSRQDSFIHRQHHYLILDFLCAASIGCCLVGALLRETSGVLALQVAGVLSFRIRFPSESSVVLVTNVCQAAVSLQRFGISSDSLFRSILYTTMRYAVEASRLLQANGRYSSRCGGGGVQTVKRWMSGSSGGSNSQQSSNAFFAWYSKKLDTHPYVLLVMVCAFRSVLVSLTCCISCRCLSPFCYRIITKCVSAGLISSIGNVLAQKITHYQQEEERKEKGSAVETPFQVDVAQVSRFALLNVAFVAPVLHHWYQFINRMVPGASWSRVLQRTWWDEGVFSVMYIPAFLGMLWKLEGSSNEDIVKMTKSQVPSIIAAEWATWVPTMILTFRFVPVKFQVLVINIVGLGWQTILALMASNAHGKETEEEPIQKVNNERDNIVNNDGLVQRAVPIIATTASVEDTDIVEVAGCDAAGETAVDCTCEAEESVEFSSPTRVDKR